MSREIISRTTECTFIVLLTIHSIVFCQVLTPTTESQIIGVKGDKICVFIQRRIMEKENDLFAVYRKANYIGNIKIQKFITKGIAVAHVVTIYEGLTISKGDKVFPSLGGKNKNYQKIKILVSRDPNTPREILEKFALDKDPFVRAAVASNEKVPVDILINFINDNSKEVHRSLASNYKTPASALRILAQSKELYYYLACNANTPSDILREIAINGNGVARATVAENDNTSVATLRILANDEHGWVKQGVARNINTPAEALKILAKDSSVSLDVAKNINTPTETLKILANDDCVSVRWAVANNSNTPEEILIKLLTDKKKHVREEAKKRLARAIK